MLDVIDLGALPAPSYAILWLTIAGPILLFALIVTLVTVNHKKFKSTETSGNIAFVAFFILMATAAVGSSLAARAVSDAYFDAKVAAIEDLGYYNVIPVAESYGADITATDKDGKGHLFDFIELPGDHIGILEVKGSK